MTITNRKRAPARCYTGIGSRSTPAHVFDRMRAIASELAVEGYELRSGGADGADTAFELGCDDVQGAKSIWLPWPGFQGRKAALSDRTFLPTPAAFAMASALHPAWSRLSRGPRSLHARNAHQVGGADLASPSSFVVCWTADGAESAADVSAKTGGTGTAIRLASLCGIPTFNLVRPHAEARLAAHLAAARELDSKPRRPLQPPPPAELEPSAPVLRFPTR